MPRKKLEKSIIIKQRRSKVPVDPERIVLALNAMVPTEGWGIMLRIIDSNVAILEEAIISKTSPVTGVVLDELGCDRLRDKLGFHKELGDTPESYSKLLKKESIEPEDFDPFYKSAQEFIAERRKTP